MKKFAQNFALEFFGDKPLHIYAVCFVFALIGAVIINSLFSGTRKKTSINNPNRFSLLFMLTDNAVSMAGALGFAFIFFRFSNYIIKDNTLLYPYALALGSGFNVLILGFRVLMKNISKKIVETINRF